MAYYATNRLLYVFNRAYSIALASDPDLQRSLAKLSTATCDVSLAFLNAFVSRAVDATYRIASCWAVKEDQGYPSAL